MESACAARVNIDSLERCPCRGHECDTESPSIIVNSLRCTLRRDNGNSSTGELASDAALPDRCKHEAEAARSRDAARFSKWWRSRGVVHSRDYRNSTAVYSCDARFPSTRFWIAYRELTCGPSDNSHTVSPALTHAPNTRVPRRLRVNNTRAEEPDDRNSRVYTPLLLYTR